MSPKGVGKTARKSAPAKAAGKAEPKLNQVHCTSCGTVTQLSDSQGGLPPCAKCGKPIVEALALLGALGIWSGDQATCPACAAKNSLWHACCYACGSKLG